MYNKTHKRSRLRLDSPGPSSQRPHWRNLLLFSCLLSASFLLLAVGTIRLLVAKGGIL